MKGCGVAAAGGGGLSKDGEFKGAKCFANAAAREPTDIAEEVCALGVVSP